MPDWHLLLALGGILLVSIAIALTTEVRRRRAQRRAEIVVSELLTPLELNQLKEQGYLDVPSRSRPGRVYRVPARPGLITVLDSGRPAARLCLVPLRAVPTAEYFVIHKLMLEGAEAEFWKLANAFPVSIENWPPGPRAAVWMRPPPGIIGQL